MFFMQLAWKDYTSLDISNQLLLFLSVMLFLSKKHDFEFYKALILIFYISNMVCMIDSLFYAMDFR